MKDTADRLVRYAGLATAAGGPSGPIATATSGASGGKVPDSALDDARSRVLSALRLAGSLLSKSKLASSADLACRLFDGALAALEGNAACGERGASCAESALGLLGTLATKLDPHEEGATLDISRPHLQARMPRVHAALLARLAPAPASVDPELEDAVEDAAKEAVGATLCICSALGTEASRFVPDYVGVCVATASELKAPLKDRLRAATALGGLATSAPAATAPFVPQGVAALVAVASGLSDACIADRAKGSSHGDDDDDDDEEDDEEPMQRLVRSRLCVLRACRRLFDCTVGGNGGADVPARLVPLLVPLVAPVVGVAESWSTGPVAFLVLDAEESEDDESEDAKGLPPDIVAAAVLELLASVSRVVGSTTLRAHARLGMPWVDRLLERSSHHSNASVKRLAIAVRKALPPAAKVKASGRA